MQIDELPKHPARTTTSTEVFNRLRDEIVSLRIPPGTRISEADIAQQLGVSRQPVRDAFIRLDGMKLLFRRPQRPTEVSKISLREVERSRFIRSAIEVEVVRGACEIYDGRLNGAFEAILKQQKFSLESGDMLRFHEQDYEFHHLICLAAGKEFAFDIIAEKKSYVDRLCMIELTSPLDRSLTYDDHAELFHCLSACDAEGAVKALRTHFTRMDSTIELAKARFPEYFEE